MTKKLLLAFVSFALALALLETGLRLLHGKPLSLSKTRRWVVVPESSWVVYDEKVGWFNERNKKAMLKTAMLSVPVKINSIGARGTREYNLKKPSGIQRLYAIGDSFTFGFGVRDEESFPAQLETCSTSREVINLGIPAYGVDQMYLLLLSFGFDYQPDIVLITLFPEDFWRAQRAYTDGGYAKPFFVMRQNGSLKLENCPVPRNVENLPEQFPDLFQRGPIENIFYNFHLIHLVNKALVRAKKLLGLEDPDSSQEWILGRAILRDMIQEIKRRSIRPILIIAPPERWITGNVEPLRDSLLNFGRRENVEVVDLTPVFKQALGHMPVENLYIPNDHHWTKEGNRLAAQELFDYLKRALRFARDDHEAIAQA